MTYGEVEITIDIIPLGHYSDFFGAPRVCSSPVILLPSVCLKQRPFCFLGTIQPHQPSSLNCLVSLAIEPFQISGHFMACGLQLHIIAELLLLAVCSVSGDVCRRVCTMTRSAIS